MSQRIGPSVWSRLWNNFLRSTTREPVKKVIAEDSVGNRFYEYVHTGRHPSSNVKRGYEPGPNNIKPSVEWESWLKGSRRFPPSENEIVLNRRRQEMPGLHKVLQGIIRYRGTCRHDMVKQFEQVKNNPNPTAMFFGCMDSRMFPARVTQSQVGDMFVVRNSGNMIPHANNYGMSGFEVSVTTEPAALELAVKRGHINHVIVCGHSDCKAINTLFNLHKMQTKFDPTSPMDHWLRRHGYASIQKLEQRLAGGPETVISYQADNPALLSFEARIDPDDIYNVEDKLSQINTLQQLTHVASHGFLADFIVNKQVFLHGMWFDIYTGDMFMFSKEKGLFQPVIEDTVNDLSTEVDREMGDV